MLRVSSSRFGVRVNHNDDDFYIIKMIFNIKIAHHKIIFNINFSINKIIFIIKITSLTTPLDPTSPT